MPLLIKKNGKKSCGKAAVKRKGTTHVLTSMKKPIIPTVAFENLSIVLQIHHIAIEIQPILYCQFFIRNKNSYFNYKNLKSLF